MKKPARNINRIFGQIIKIISTIVKYIENKNYITLTFKVNKNFNIIDYSIKYFVSLQRKKGEEAMKR